MVERGATAVVAYTGTLADGTVFDSTEGVEPLEFEVGGGRVIHGFDEAVAGMAVGDRTSVVVPAAGAYGDYVDEKVQTFPMAAIPGAKDIKVGKPFYFITQEGLRFPAKVLSVDAGLARVDFNHPLAGKDLHFEIELLDVRGAGASAVESASAGADASAPGV